MRTPPCAPLGPRQPRGGGLRDASMRQPLFECKAGLVSSKAYSWVGLLYPKIGEIGSVCNEARGLELRGTVFIDSCSLKWGTFA